MMLSELYGRIGQQLKEHGDAEIVRFPLPNEVLNTGRVFRKTNVSFTYEYEGDGTVWDKKQYILNFT